MRKQVKKRVKTLKFMNKRSFFIVGKHAVLEALKNREIDAQKRRYRATSASRGKDW